jgi:hypothetical protein
LTYLKAVSLISVKYNVILLKSEHWQANSINNRNLNNNVSKAAISSVINKSGKIQTKKYRGPVP